MSGATNPRPLSPHLQIWRWHVTMATSIFHRATGVALYATTALLVAWLVSLASGPEVYAPVEAFLQGALGQAALFAALVALAYHLANGVRHLAWDTGAHLNPKAAGVSAWLAIAFAIAAPTALFAYLRMGG